jgi:hypothetical protein
MVIKVTRVYPTGYNTHYVEMGSDEDALAIHYGMGILLDGETFKPDMETGVHYYETLSYTPNKLLKKVLVDDVMYANIYCDVIDYFKNAKHVSSRDMGLERKARIATIRAMEVNTLWDKKNAVRTLMFSTDSSNLYNDNTKIEALAVFDRGVASAWETHFKLSECNTLDDLKKYGNNYFNI